MGHGFNIEVVLSIGSSILLPLFIKRKVIIWVCFVVVIFVIFSGGNLNHEFHQTIAPSLPYLLSARLLGDKYSKDLPKSTDRGTDF